MAATTGVIWLRACVRYWPYRGVGTFASVLKLVCSLLYLLLGSPVRCPSLSFSHTQVQRGRTSEAFFVLCY